VGERHRREGEESQEAARVMRAGTAGQDLMNPQKARAVLNSLYIYIGRGRGTAVIYVVLYLPRKYSYPRARSNAFDVSSMRTEGHFDHGSPCRPHAFISTKSDPHTECIDVESDHVIEINEPSRYL